MNFNVRVMGITALVFGFFVLSLSCIKVKDFSNSKSKNAGEGRGIIGSLNENQRVRFMAAVSSSVYCGNDNQQCQVLPELSKHLGELGLPSSLGAWQIALLSARDAQKDMEGYLFYREDSDDIVIGMRGSESEIGAGAIQDWVLVDGSLLPSYYQGSKVQGQVHSGYLNGMYGIWHPNETGLIRVLEQQNGRQKSLWLTGHSLGGAVSILLAMRAYEDNYHIGGVYTFGTPKMALYDFQDSYNRQLGEKTFQYINKMDPVPHLLMPFVSVGKSFHLDGGSIKSLAKDGSESWTIAGFFLLGNPNHHYMATGESGYIQMLKGVTIAGGSINSVSTQPSSSLPSVSPEPVVSEKPTVSPEPPPVVVDPVVDQQNIANREICKKQGTSEQGLLCADMGLKDGEYNCIWGQQWACTGLCSRWLSGSCPSRVECKSRGLSSDGASCKDLEVKEGEYRCVGTNKWTCINGCAKWVGQC